eukprot:3059041-Rhodomonas_salina.4
MKTTCLAPSGQPSTTTTVAPPASAAPVSREPGPPDELETQGERLRLRTSEPEREEAKASAGGEAAFDGAEKKLGGEVEDGADGLLPPHTVTPDSPPTGVRLHLRLRQHPPPRHQSPTLARGLARLDARVEARERSRGGVGPGVEARRRRQSERDSERLRRRKRERTRTRKEAPR